MQDIKNVIQIMSGIIDGGCDHCHDEIKSFPIMGVCDEYHTNKVNHYVQKHGYKILHVGQYTDTEVDGGLWHGVIFVLGHNEILPLKEPTEEMKELLAFIEKV